MRTPILCVATLCLAIPAAAFDFGRLMITGDSLTEGTGLAPYAFRERLHQNLVTGGHTFTNVGPLGSGDFPGTTGGTNRHAGFGGWSIKDLVQGRPAQPQAGNLGQWMVDYQPDTVVFMAGVNDIWDTLFNTANWGPTLQTNIQNIIPARYESVMQTIYNANPNARVFLVAPPKLLPNGTDYRLPYSEALRGIVQATATHWAGQGKDVHFVDLWTPTSSIPGVHFGPDNVHWNEAGAQLAGDTIYGQMEAVPEPMTMTVLALAGGWLARRRAGKQAK